MAKYIIRFEGEKRVDNWDPERGASGKDRIIDNWTATIESNTRLNLSQFNDFTYDRYSIEANQFRYWPGVPGRFSASRVEDADGNDDKKGKYLADYDVYVTCTPVQNPVPIGHLSLESIDGE